MNDQMHTGIAEATRLTQQGRLDEAIAAIQRALGGTFAPAAQESPGNTNEPIEVISRLVSETPQGPAGARRTAVLRPGAAAWTTPGPTLLTRGVQLPPGTKAGKLASGSVLRGRTLRRAYVHQQRRDSLLQTVHPEWLHRASRSPDRHAPRLHPEPGRLCYRHPHERTRRGAHIPRRVSRSSGQRQHAEVLELVPGCGSAARSGRTVAHCGHHETGGRRLRGRRRQGVRSRDVGRRSYGRDHGRDLSRSLRRSRRPLRPRPWISPRYVFPFTAMRQGGPIVAHKDVAGREYREVLPTILFHGDGDTIVHPRNGDRILTHLAGGGDGSVPRVGTCQGQVPGGYQYTRLTYRDAEGRDLSWSGGACTG